MRALEVEALLEAVELGLLLQEVAARGTRGLFLQSQMHALMTAVLLRISGFDALDADAEP